MSVEPILARKNWRTLEPYHGFIYFSPEATTEYQAVGLKGTSGYFASRAAPMGAVTAPVVTATFFNFAPATVEAAMDGVWDTATPTQVHDARLRAVDTGLRRMLGDLIDTPEISEALELARKAGEACSEPGRPLYAGLRTVAVPAEPHLALWLALSLLREFRGDGHIVALTAEGLGALEALHLHAASGEVPVDLLKLTRGWSDEDWNAAHQDMIARGLVDDAGGLTEQGAALRQHVEDTTDRLALPPWQHLGEPGTNRLRELVRPFSRAIIESGGVGFKR